jgi:hypothetical protein
MKLFSAPNSRVNYSARRASVGQEIWINFSPGIQILEGYWYPMSSDPASEFKRCGNYGEDGYRLRNNNE